MRICSRSAPPKQSTVSTWSGAETVFEERAEVRLVSKSGGKRDIQQRNIRGRELAACVVKAQPANVFSGCAAMVASKDPCEVRRMNAHSGGGGSKRYVFSETVMEKIRCSAEPVGGSTFGLFATGTTGFSQELEQQPLDAQVG
jgi:hypothetical protein